MPTAQVTPGHPDDVNGWLAPDPPRTPEQKAEDRETEHGILRIDSRIGRSARVTRRKR